MSSQQRIDLLLTGAVCTLWTLFFPYLYYYSFGLAAFLEGLAFLAIALPLTVWWITRIIRRAVQKAFYAYLLLPAGFLSMGSNLFLSEELLEELDWKYYYSTRMELVEDIRTGKLPVTDGRIQTHYFPPISNGGNEVFVSRDGTGGVTVTFYINRGFLDHYSAFVYSTAPEEVKALEAHITRGKGNHINKKLTGNWYRVSY